MASRLHKHPQFAKLARTLARQNHSTREIADELTSKGYPISHNAVGEFLRDVMDGAHKLIASDEVIEQEAKKEILDTAKQLKEINDEMWNIIKQLKENFAESGYYDLKTVNTMISALDKISKQIELQSKISGRIFSGTKNVTVNYLDVSSKMNVYIDTFVTAQLDRMVLDGVINADDRVKMKRYLTVT